MDSARFDNLTRVLSAAPSRRGALAALLCGPLGLLGLTGAGARNKRKKGKGKKGKKKKKRCPGNQILCVDLCVDPDDNEQHCGGCNSPCQGDLTCLSGECRCAVGTMCGNHCVDLQTDPDHCGACNDPCDNDDPCVGGECNRPGCGANQIDCGNGLCIPDHEHACCSEVQCGGDNSQLHCDTAVHRCICNNSGEGICRRTTGGGGLCHTCCPGGDEVCLGDHVCFVRDDAFGPYGICNCPTGYQTCHFGLANRCSQDQLTDINRCGTNCTDCETANPGSRCCQGGCARGKNPGQSGESGMPCGNNCLPCPIGQMCCNSGPGTSGECVDVGTGACPE